MTAKKTETKQEVTLFTKEQILSAKEYSNRRDVLGAILDDEKQYSKKEVGFLLEKFMKGKVK